ncbi:MAG: porin family protein [Cryomorphaceae bacterium]|nr:PorT family protein [Flavobacteriales bacterium]
MKKLALSILCLSILLSLSVDDAFAQDPSTGSKTPPKFRMGLSASPVVSWFDPNGDDAFAEPDGPRINIKYGLHMDFRLGNSMNYYFSTGLFVLNSGGTITHPFFGEDGGVGTQTIDHRTNYLNIPLTMMLRTNEIGYMTYFARVGFDTGLNIKTNYDRTIEIGNTTSKEEEVGGPDLTNLFRAGLHIEGGLEYNLTGNTNLYISVEWNNGLNNVFTKDYVVPRSIVELQQEEGRRVKANNNAIIVNVGIYF